MYLCQSCKHALPRIAQNQFLDNFALGRVMNGGGGGLKIHLHMKVIYVNDSDSGGE